MQIRQCSWLDLEEASGIEDVFAAYAAESSIDAIGTPKCQYRLYRGMEQAGFLKVVGAFYGEAVVGFMLFVVTVLPHYGEKVATTESFFVLPEWRKCGTGWKLRGEAERIAQESGAVGLFISAPVGSKLERAMELDKQYQATNRVFFRSFA